MSWLMPGGPGIWRGFELFFHPWLRRKLHGIHLAGLPRPEALPDPALPLVLVANHVSWFDGFLLREVQRRVRPQAPLYTVMLESELKNNRVLRALGGVGFDPERPMGLRRVVRGLAAYPDRVSRGSSSAAPVVAFFPQGRIYPSFREPLGFRPGVRLVIRGLAPCTVLGVGMHLEPGNTVAPCAFLHLAPPLTIRSAEEAPGPEALEAGVASALSRIHRHLRTYGEAAAEAWPGDPVESLGGPEARDRSKEPGRKDRVDPS